MTDAEYEKLAAEVHEYVARTTFPPTQHDAEDQFQARTEHAEQMGSWS